MKLPLRIQFDFYGRDTVYDADHQRVCSHPVTERKFTLTLVRKMNRNWRHILFGAQPYVYTREDWLLERNTGKS